MKIAIANKNALSRTKLKFMTIVWTQVGIASTPKYFEKVVVGCLIIEALQWSDIANNFARKAVYKIGGSDKGFVPIFERHRCMSKKG